MEYNCSIKSIFLYKIMKYSPIEPLKNYKDLLFSNIIFLLFKHWQHIGKGINFFFNVFSIRMTTRVARNYNKKKKKKTSLSINY